MHLLFINLSNLRVALFIIISFFFVKLNGQNCSDLSGTWVNELGSALVIDSINSEGKIIGKYASSTGVDGSIFPLEGWVNKNEEYPEEINISFSVKWTGYGSITSWTGYCKVENNESMIKTMWYLVRSGQDFEWERIISNSSTFKPNNN